MGTPGYPRKDEYTWLVAGIPGVTRIGSERHHSPRNDTIGEVFERNKIGNPDNNTCGESNGRRRRTWLGASALGVRARVPVELDWCVGRCKDVKMTVMPVLHADSSPGREYTDHNRIPGISTVV